MNETIGNFTVNNVATTYRLQLIDTYNGGLELDQNQNTLILKRSLDTFPLSNNQSQLQIKVALINETNGTILTTNFSLKIIFETIIDPCLNKDCGNGTCIHQNET